MRKNERGIALIIVLFATLLLTVIGLGMMYSTNMETAINGNYRDSQVALYAALAGLQQGRERLKYPYTGFTPPSQLPSLNSPNIIYIVSDASVVQPWDPDNAYFDTELCQGKVLGLTGTTGVPCTETADGDDWYEVVDNSSSSTWNLASTLPAWKWTRIQLKGNNNTPVAVNGNSTDGSQACWDGVRQMSTPTGYTTGCQPTGGVNAININAAGSGYASAPTITLSGGGGSGATASASMVAETTGVVTSIAVDTGGSYATTPSVVVSGSATATATLSGTGTTVNIGGSVTSIGVSSVGSGYTAAPAVTVSGGGGTGATAIANLATSGAVSITGGTVTSASVTTGGGGYSSAPTVTITGGGGSGATATANVIDDGSGGTITGGSVTGVSLSAGGTGYTSAPTITFTGGGGGTGASATAVLAGTGTTVVTGNVTGYSVTNGGSGYTSAPSVTLTGGDGTGATATATLASTGSIKSVTLSSAGTQCYSTASDVTVSITGTGTGATASAVLDTTRSCIRTVQTYTSPNCSFKLQTGASGTTGTYPTTGTATNITLSAGNYSMTGTLVTDSNNKTPYSFTVVNPGYDTSAYNAAPLATNPYLRLSGGAAWADCGNVQVSPSAGYRVASFTVTNGGSGYTGTPTVTVGGCCGSTSVPTATATVGYAVSQVSVANPGTGYSVAPTVSFSGGGGGSGAAATASAFGTSSTTYAVAGITLNSGGSGYVSVPTMTFSGGGGSGAAGTASITTTGTSLYKVSSITITGGGTGYTSTPTISFSGGGSGSGAAATAGVTNTTLTTYPVESITVTAGGSGYTSTPTVSLSGGSGTGAAGAANVTFITSTTYPVASIAVTSGGSGYTAAPTVTLSGGGGTGGGAATATIDPAVATGTYSIDHIDVTAAGSGYTSNPTLTFTGGGGGSGAEGTSQISGGTRYGKVYLVTALAVTSTGGRAMVQGEVASPVLGWGSGGALTLDGPSPSIDAMPNSNNFRVVGTDANSCGETAEPAHPAIAGYDNPNTTPATHSVEDIIDALPTNRHDHYTGVGATPSVQNGYDSLGETMSTPAGMDSVMSAIYNTPGAHHYTAANVASFNESATTTTSINYVDGDLTLSGNTRGKGILVVTGTLHMQGNFGWDGVIFVVGDGNFQAGGGGNGQMNGMIWVAKIWDNYTNKNLLSTMGSPTFHWNGGGGNGIRYDHCLATNLLNSVSLSNVNSVRPLKALSYRSLAY